MTKAEPSRPAAKRRQQHGLTPGVRAVKGLGERAISDVLDGRTKAAKDLAAWRDALVTDMGGMETVSAQQYTVLEQAARVKVILDAIDSWLFQDTSRVLNKRARSMSPIAHQRQKIADALVRYLTALGLERRAEALTLEAYVEDRYGDD